MDSCRAADAITGSSRNNITAALYTNGGALEWVKDVHRHISEGGHESESACSHAGFVDEGQQIFCASMKDYGVEPTVSHYSYMVDLLGRAGLLDETKRFISSMPMEADASTWGALLGACRTYGNVELCELTTGSHTFSRVPEFSENEKVGRENGSQ